MKFTARKKPVEVEAIMWVSDSELSTKLVLEFMGQTVCSSTFISQEKFSEYCDIVKREGLKIHTLEGTMTASSGDYIICGINGEYYPCKPDIFEKTYDVIKEIK